MFSRLRKRFTHANVAMTLALVFAMSGGAYAAGKYLITSTKQISPKVLKALQGKPGAKGGAGPAGAPGAQGPAGAGGAKGENGANGTNGTNGKDGVSVTSSAEPKGANCKEGGSKFVAVSGTTYACNGEKGAAGKNGTFGSEPLPPGKTMTGTYAAASFAEDAVPNPGFGRVDAGVSFALPVPGEPEVAVHYIKEGETLPAGCTGSATEPGAEEGNLCVFGEVEVNTFSTTVNRIGSFKSTLGFTVFSLSKEKGSMQVAGTWAVTAK